MSRFPTDALVAALLILCAASVLAGAWGAGSFDNDDALDWAQAFEAKPGMSALVAALEAVTGSGYLEAPEGSAAIAAAEVLAAVAGKPSPKLPADLAAWARKQPKESALQQLPLARKAVERIARGEDSELRELWQEGDAAAWQASIAELEARLSP
jgi:hypothetical protein